MSNEEIILSQERYKGTIFETVKAAKEGELWLIKTYGKDNETHRIFALLDEWINKLSGVKSREEIKAEILYQEELCEKKRIAMQSPFVSNSRENPIKMRGEVEAINIQIQTLKWVLSEEKRG